MLALSSRAAGCASNSAKLVGLRLSQRELSHRSFKQMSSMSGAIYSKYLPRPMKSTEVSSRSLPRILSGSQRGLFRPTSVAESSNMVDTRSYSSEAATDLKADDYIQELQDLYEIAKDELEIAAESTAASTIYAVSDRITLREALDDLDYTYAVYTGTEPLPSAIERRGESEKEWQGQRRATNFDPKTIPDGVRTEIKKRVGQRIRELRNAVEALEESAQES